MDPSESSKNNKEDKPSSPQLSHLAGPVSPDFDLSFLNTFDHDDSFLLDEIDCKQLFENESDINIGGELPSDEDPHNTEEPRTVPQELLEYFDGDIEFDFVEWTTPERREANEFAGLVFDPQDCHDSHGQAIKKRRLQSASNADIGSDNSSFPTHFQEVPLSGSTPPLDDTNISTPVLHLNSLVDALPPVHSATTDQGLMETTKRKNTRLRLVFSPDRYGRSTVHITRHEPSLHSITTESHETHNPSVAADMVTSDSDSPSMTQPLTSSLSPANVDHDDKSTTISTTNDKDTDDSRKCTCKRSACAKLYCDCFAAELYCAECCTCQGCINRAEYKDFLLDIKKNMMSRDPFAFAPKIVQDATNTLSNNTENDNLKTPSSSARHRKGCHCTKSKCLKNYCECFEIKVGCTGACQCLGCENSYGRKGHVANEGAMSKEKDSDGVEKSSDSLHAELGDNNDVHGFSPLTPSLHLQRSNMGQSSDASPVTPQGSSARLMNPLMTGLEETTTDLERLELSPSASGGLTRPGRKFVWRSVPSFPPLTPSIHSKANDNDGGDGAKEPEKRS